MPWQWTRALAGGGRLRVRVGKWQWHLVKEAISNADIVKFGQDKVVMLPSGTAQGPGAREGLG